MKSPQATILGQISKMGSANDIDTHSNSQKLIYSGEGMHIHNICTIENYNIIYISQQKPRQWSAYGQSAYVQSPYVQSAQEDRDSVQAGKGHMDVSAYMYLLLVGERFLHIAVNAPRVKSHTLYIYLYDAVLRKLCTLFPYKISEYTNDVTLTLHAHLRITK